ncbi:MAG: nucleoside-diphosphate kinase [Deltaproteobacteria bacterium]|nr:nucleoside-diphosphate kinase [Deltaproteobacteria bacterium]
MLQKTLAIIKPDAVAAGKAGAIIARYEKAGFRILAMKMVRLNQAQAEGFYEVHKQRPFFGSLTAFMTSGPCIPMILEAEDAIAKNRELMGATDPAEAAEGTLRADFAENKERNAVHGSDAPETAEKEIAFFFSPYELLAL